MSPCGLPLPEMKTSNKALIIRENVQRQKQLPLANCQRKIMMIVGDIPQVASPIDVDLPPIFCGYSHCVMLSVSWANSKDHSAPRSGD